jgi:hypothetical protein
MLERDRRIFFGDLRDCCAPELRDLEDVGLIDGGDLLASFARKVKGNAGNTDDLSLCVAHRIDRLVGLAIPPAWRPEVKTAEQLAHEENVNVFGDFGTQGRTFGKRRVSDGRAQVGKASKRLANLQETSFGALIWRQGVELVIADGAK